MKAIVLLALISCCHPAFAQPFTLDPNIRPAELKLHKFTPAKEPDAKGKISVTEVTQVKDTLYFFAKGISIYSPVYVGITAKNESQPLDISLHKMNWKDVARSGSTDEKGRWQEKFKTENDFGIRVITKNKPADYAIVLWAGDEPKMELPTVFKKGGNKDKATVAGAQSDFFSDNLLYIIMGVLAIAVAILFLKLKGKKHETKTN